MPGERTSLVAGPYGDSSEDPQLEARLLESWSRHAPTERLGEIVYSRWKFEGPLPSRTPRFSPGFWVGAAVYLVVVLVVVRLGAERIRAGDLLLTQAAPFLLLALLFAPVGVLLFVLKRPTATPSEPSKPPAGVPPHAIPSLAGSAYVGRSLGWLWFEGDRMLFQGAGFDFRLRREDFTTRGSVRNALCSKEGAGLRLPPGLSSHRLRLMLGRLVDGKFQGDPKRWDELRDDLAAWESGGYSKEFSLFPPVRPVPSLPLRIGWGHIVLPPLLMAAMLGGVALLLPIVPRDGSPENPMGVVLAGAAFGAFWPAILWSTRATSRNREREVERAFAHDQKPL